MGIGAEIESRRTALNAGQSDLLDRIESDRADPDRFGDGADHDILRDCLHQPQHLDELAFAAIAHPCLHQMTQVLERLGQAPVLQRCGLIERVRLHLDQRQIVQRVEDEDARTITALMPRDLLAAAQDDGLIDEAFTMTSWKPKAVGTE